MKPNILLSVLFASSALAPLIARAESFVPIPESNLTYEGYTERKALREAAKAKPIKPPTPPKGSLRAGDQRIEKGKVFGVEKDARSIKPSAFGPAQIPFSAKRVRNVGEGKIVKNISSKHPGWLSAQKPYSAFGKLTFKNGKYTGSCTAQLIRRSVIVTAAHCLGPYGARRYYRDWKFTPAYYKHGTQTSAPYGTWRMIAGGAPPVWYYGNDPQGKSTNDLAVLILEKKSNTFVGQRTGYLRYATSPYSFTKSPLTKLNVASVTTIGYPGSMDKGGVMQISTGPAFMGSYRKTPQYVIGGYFNGGSSGGGWLVNFGFIGHAVPRFGSGTYPGNAPYQAIIGLTSWGDNSKNTTKRIFSPRFGKNRSYPRDTYMTNKSRVPGSGNLGYLLNAACGQKPARSNKTYWELGYCS